MGAVGGNSKFAAGRHGYAGAVGDSSGSAGRRRRPDFVEDAIIDEGASGGGVRSAVRWDAALSLWVLSEDTPNLLQGDKAALVLWVTAAGMLVGAGGWPSLRIPLMMAPVAAVLAATVLLMVVPLEMLMLW